MVIHRRSIRARPASYDTSETTTTTNSTSREVSKALREVLQRLTDDENFIRRVACKLFDLVSLRVTGVLPELPYFYRVMPLWDGTRSSSGRKYKCAWTTLIELCAKYGVSPVEYLIDALAEWKLASTPEPNRLITENKVKAFSRYLPNKNEITRELLLQREAAQRLFFSQRRMYTAMGLPNSDQFAHTAVIGSTAPPFTPLFCYVYALSVGAFDQAAKLQAHAVMQYLTHRRTYDKVWGDLIPESLRQSTCQILTKLTEEVEYVPTGFPAVCAAPAGD